MANNSPLSIHATTVVGIIHNGQMSLGADGQATMGATVLKSNVKKVRLLAKHDVLAAFAGGTADAFTLMERFEDKMDQYNGNMKRAAVELARDWRSDRFLRRLEALMIVMKDNQGMIITGTGDVIEPEYHVLAIGSGGMYAQAAALAMLRHAPQATAEEIVRASLNIAADICIYTNHNLEVITR
jgi:ATP-dependent HslUV protease, peptidase subunit HslV